MPRKNEKASRNQDQLPKTCQTDKHRGSHPCRIFSMILKTFGRKDFRKIEQSTRKLTTMYTALHPSEDSNRLNMSRKERGRGIASIENCIDAS